MEEARKVIEDELAINSFTFYNKNCVTILFPIDFEVTFNLIATKIEF